MKRRKFLQNTGMLGIAPLFSLPLVANSAISIKPALLPRTLWLNYLEKLSAPVLDALAVNQLKEKMPVEAKEPVLVNDRAKYTHLEAFGRLLAGIAPWLQAELLSKPEKQLQDKYFKLALK